MADTTTRAAFAGQYVEDAVVEAARGRGEPDWLVEARGQAARAFAASPMPTPKLRPWKYTDVTELAIDSFAPLLGSATTVEAEAPAGGFAGSMFDALSDDAEAERVREHLGALVKATEGKFIAANAALWSGGAYVRVPRGKAFDRPVVVDVDVEADEASGLFPRVLIVAEPGSEAAVVVRNRSGDAPLLAPGVVEIFAGQDSSVRLVLQDDWGAGTQEFTTVRSRLGRGATVQVASLNLGGRIVKQTVEALLEGEGANSTIRGVALGGREQHFDFVTLQDHIGPRTVSDVEIKSALAGASKSIYYGITRVGEDANGAEANQENRNLLLSSRAKADSDPVLEILTSEVVRCGHGATVGPVDREALFYLQSRGLERRQALQLLVSGFFRSVLDDIPVPGMAEELEAAVVAKLGTADLN
jgi:Fe-S cluster assembly protein SufD